MLTTDLLTAFDPVRLAVALGIQPDDWQRDLLRGTERQALLLTCRQAGKSTIAAVMALHRAAYFPGSVVLLLSPSLRQSGELHRKVVGFASKLGEAGAPIAAESALRLELKNGSRIVALPGSETTVRGYSNVALLVVDEASRVDDALYYSIRPMLAVSGGRLVALTTPWGKRGFFYNEWSDESTGTQRVRVLASECPRISADFLAHERATLPRRWFAQEYETSFEDLADAAFGADLVAGLVDPDIKPLFGPDADTGRLADVLPIAAHGGER